MTLTAAKLEEMQKSREAYLLRCKFERDHRAADRIIYNYELGIPVRAEYDYGPHALMIAETKEPK